MAFTPSEPADPAKYFSAGLQIAERMRENAAAQERNKINDTFNQQMARMQMGMQVEQQAFNRLNMMQDNARQQQALGVELFKATKAPEAEWGYDAQGNLIPKNTANPYAGLNAQAGQMITGGSVPAAGTPATVAAPEGNGIWPNKPMPQEEPANVGSILPGGAATDVAQPPVVGEALPPELQSPADAVPQEIPPAQGDAVPQEIPAATPGSGDWLTPLIRKGVEQVNPNARAIFAAQDRTREAQKIFDDVLAKRDAVDARIAQDRAIISTRPNSAFPPNFESRNADLRRPVLEELERAERKLRLSENEANSLLDANSTAAAKENFRVARTRQLDQQVGNALKVNGLTPDHPIVSGFGKMLSLTDPAQQDKAVDDKVKEITAVGRLQNNLNGPLFESVRAIEPQFKDSILRVNGPPGEVQSALTKVLNAKARMDSNYAAANPALKINPQTGKPVAPLPDEAQKQAAAQTRYLAAQSDYDGAIFELSGYLDVVPKPRQEPTLAPGEGVRRLPAAAAGAAPAATPAAATQAAARQLTGMAPQQTTPQPTVGDWWTARKTEVSAGRGSDARNRVPSMNEFDDATLLAVINDQPVFVAEGGGLTFDQAKAATRLMNDYSAPEPMVAGKAAEQLALELGFAPGKVAPGGDSRKNTGNRWSDVTYRDIVREAAKDEYARRKISPDTTATRERVQKANDFVNKNL